MAEGTEDVSGKGQDSAAWQVLAPVIDFVTPMAVRAAATLRVADLMTDGPVPVDELARRSGCDPDALGRLLAHLVCHGVFTEPAQGIFGLNDLGTLLRSDHPGGMQVSLDLDGFGGQMDLAFTGLLHTMRTGQPAWETVFGAPFWHYLAANQVMSASFDATMTAGAEYVADDVSGYDWSLAERVVDVGGGDGALLVAILEAHPRLRATLVDLPDTVERGQKRLVARGLDGRCAFVGQSFFDVLPTDGDLYVLNSVLHDWGDEEAAAILSRCAEAVGDRGRVVIIEETGTGEGDGAGFAEMNLRMLVLAGGRERRLDEYTALADGAGLAVTDTHTTTLGQIVIECVTKASAATQQTCKDVDMNTDGQRDVDWRDWLRRWDRQQEGYIPEREARFTAMFDAVEELLPESFVALDLACGPGSVSQRLLARFPGARAVAVEMDPVMLALGQGALDTLGGRLRWIETDLASPDWLEALGERHFDVVLSTTSLHWLWPDTLNRVYQDLARLLRPGGLFLNGDHLAYGPELATLARLSQRVLDEQWSDAAFAEHGIETAEQWWDEFGSEPVLAPLLAERARLFARKQRQETAPGFDAHVAALHKAGFAEVGTIWQVLSNRVLLAVR